MVVLVLSLVTRFVPAARKLGTLHGRILWTGVVAFFVWISDGRLALFAAVGSILALGAVVLLTFWRASQPLDSRWPMVARMMVGPALILGAVAGIATECGGRWSGAEFVVWRGIASGVVALAAGIAFVDRAIRK